MSKYSQLLSDETSDTETNAFNYAEMRSKKMKKICIGVFALLFAIAALIAVIAVIVSPKIENRTLTLITTTPPATSMQTDATTLTVMSSGDVTTSPTKSVVETTTSTLSSSTLPPTASSMTPSSTTQPPAVDPYNYTRPDPSQFRLPQYVVPTAYRLDLQPNLDTFQLFGLVEIELNVSVATDEILLHALQINVSSATLMPFAESASNISYYPGKDGELGFVLFRFPSLGKATRTKSRNQFTLKLQYEGVLADDMVRAKKKTLLNYIAELSDRIGRLAFIDRRISMSRDNDSGSPSRNSNRPVLDGLLHFVLFFLLMFAREMNAALFLASMSRISRRHSKWRCALMFRFTLLMIERPDN